MNGAPETSWQTLENYLAQEEHSPVRREYWSGSIFPADAESTQHEIILQNLFSSLQQQLIGSGLKVYAAEMKLRVPVGEQSLLYYPDIIITDELCNPGQFYCCHPQVIIEVSSALTELSDRRSKFLFLRQIKSLQEYVLVEENRLRVTIFRRENHWQPESLQLPTHQMRIPSLEFSLPLASVYERATG